VKVLESKMKNRKNEIILAARKRFSKHGLHKTTLDEIARDMRIGKATIYHYFNSKLELFSDTVNYEINQLMETLNSILTNSEMTFKERLRLYISTKIQLKINFPLIFMLIKINLYENRLESERELLNVLVYKEISIVRLFVASVAKDIPDDKNIEFSKTLTMQSYNIPLTQELEFLEDVSNNYEDSVNGYLYFFGRLFPSMNT
jgi:AcrR family transcriptional regulator